MTHTPTNADDVTVIQADRDMVEEMDEALGFITERERPILLAAFARHRIAHQSTGEVERLREALNKCAGAEGISEVILVARAALAIKGGE